MQSRLSQRRRPSRRDEMIARRTVLITEAEHIDTQYQQLAQRMTIIRGELTRLRDAIWPALLGRGWRGFRRPRIGGPEPVGRAASPAYPLRGRELRFAALGVLVRAGRPLTLPEIHRALHVAGYEVAGQRPVKDLADALGYEHDHGRARRVRRGVYEVGELTPYRRRRVFEMQREQLQRRDDSGHGVARFGGIQRNGDAGRA
ncbi:MAG TPA: hypothetical protein VIB48_13900 [Acidimicrobiia bacterium]|jgi:hypothetical protein